MAMFVCDACGGVKDSIIKLPTGKLPIGQLCERCDSLGRIAAARQAYQVEKHRQAVSRGYQQSQIQVEDTK